MPDTIRIPYQARSITMQNAEIIQTRQPIWMPCPENTSSPCAMTIIHFVINAGATWGAAVNNFASILLPCDI